MLREDRRRQILDAARTEFAASGYHATGVAAIIERCGIARGTFYLYFESKRKIFETLLDEFLEMLNLRIRRVDETVGLDGIRAQVRQNVMDVLAAFAENPELTRIILNEAVGLDKGFDEKLSQFYGELMDLIDRSLQLGIAIGILHPWDTRIIAATILGSIKEVVQQLLRGRVAMRPEMERMVDELIGYHLRALLREEIRELPDNSGTP